MKNQLLAYQMLLKPFIIVINFSRFGNFKHNMMYNHSTNLLVFQNFVSDTEKICYCHHY